MQIRVKRGLDLAIPGAPEQAIFPGRRVSTVALVGSDYPLLKPSLEVAEGDRVDATTPLFIQRSDPAIRYTSPGTGRVVAINRGARRRLLSVVIELDSDEPESPGGAVPDRGAALKPDSIRETLLTTGLWASFRTRRFGVVPSPARIPKAMLVTAIDTNPLAANPAVVIESRREHFERGIEVIKQLASGETFVCKAPASGSGVPVPDDAIGAEFSGPHPAGLPGTHAHYLVPKIPPDEIWQIGYQDVIAIGELFATGKLSHERVIALAGPGVSKPRLLRTRTGASLEQLLRGEIDPGSDAISGSVLSGRRISESTGYLGRYDTQLSVLERDPDVESRASAWSSGMLCVEAFERVWPFAMPPLPLLRALLIGDTETAEALGCLGLDREDLALCSYVCPAKRDYGEALKAVNSELARVA